MRYYSLPRPANSLLLQPETIACLAKIPPGCVNKQSSDFGIAHHEPLLFGLDGLLRYAKAYRQRFEGTPVAEDYHLRKPFFAAANAYRRLLDGDGAAAWEADRSTDSKDNGAMFDLFEAVMTAGGFKPEDWQ